MTIPPPLRHWVPRLAYGAICVAAAVCMVVKFLSLSIPFHGHAWLPRFGEMFEPRMSDTFLAESRYLVTSPVGYDGQFYAQLAIDPLLRDPQTAKAFDNYHFRARRPLFPLIAHLAGRLDPGRSVRAYCVLNLVFWLIFAVLLTHWLPPTSWQNTLRFVATLYSIGFVESITRTLLDGPATVLVTLAVFVAEKRRSRLAAIVLSLATLGKETSVLALTLFGLPHRSDPRQLATAAMRAAIVALPLAGWLAYLACRDAGAGSSALGKSNFDWPLFAWGRAVGNLAGSIGAGGWATRNVITAAFLFAMPLQAVALLVAWKPSCRWWRVGAVFAVFTFVAGMSTWEGVVGSITRVCLPVTVAFNIAIPRTKRWLAVLLAGNALSVIGFHEFWDAQAPRTSETDRNVAWTQGWHGAEQDAENHWRWSSGNAAIEIRNAKAVDSAATLRLQTWALRPTDVTVLFEDRTSFVFHSGPDTLRDAAIPIPLRPGSNTIRFVPDEPAAFAPGDPRPLSFAIRNPIIVRHAAAEPAGSATRRDDRR